jgi:hypothetical protein
MLAWERYGILQSNRRLLVLLLAGHGQCPSRFDYDDVNFFSQGCQSHQAYSTYLFIAAPQNNLLLQAFLAKGIVLARTGHREGTLGASTTR